jgi:catechol 2,3-dioxygenase-like lactoylglutathione lyase family enzyme
MRKVNISPVFCSRILAKDAYCPLAIDSQRSRMAASRTGERIMKLERLDHFGIEVNELARAERFYTEVLGLTVVAHLGDQTLLQCGDQNLALFHVRRSSLTKAERQKRISHPLGSGHHAFRVSREDFDAAAERLAQAGVETAQPIDWGDHDCLYFLDLDGNLLEIVSYR